MRAAAEAIRENARRMLEEHGGLADQAARFGVDW
jgi:hypothetical protein